MIFIYITCKDKEEAEKIGLVLIRKRLAACVNIFPHIKSIFSWRGKIEKKEEAVLIVKTLKNNFKKVERAIRESHSYSVPCILEIPIAGGSKEYLNWLKSEIEP